MTIVFLWASITGSVFVDVNGNGVYEANEPGIDGIAIELHNENGVAILDNLGNPITATTSDGGFYLFEDLNLGTYLLCEVHQTTIIDWRMLLASKKGRNP